MILAINGESMFASSAVLIVLAIPIFVYYHKHIFERIRDERSYKNPGWKNEIIKARLYFILLLIILLFLVILPMLVIENEVYI